MSKLEAAQAAFEDAASRGFPKNNRAQLQHDIDVATGDESSAGVHFAAHALVADLEVEAATEIKTYSDGTVATGVAPLPELSPKEQDAAEGPTDAGS